MEIRFAETRDIPGMINLLLEVGEVHHRIRPDLFRAGAQKYDEQTLARMLTDDTRPIFVAVEDGKVLGYCFCILQVRENDPVLLDDRTLYIDDICVDERARGKHVGTELYDHVLDYARAHGYHNVTLNAWAANPAAVKFYESLGMSVYRYGMEQIL